MQFKVRYRGSMKSMTVEPLGRGDEVVLRCGSTILCHSVNFSRLVADARSNLGINLMK